MERKRTLKINFLGVLKSYEFIVEMRFGQDERHQKKTNVERIDFFKKQVLSQPMVLSQRELDL